MLRLKRTILILLTCSWLTPDFAEAQEQYRESIIDYIETYAPLAIREMKRTGFPASIKIAQGIHESGAGKSPLSLKSNNHFGMKCKTSWTGEKVYHNDDELGECFRKYETVEESYMDHSDYLKSQQRYATLFTFDPDDYKAWSWGLKNAGYATNPVYAQTLIKYIETYELNELNHYAEDGETETDDPDLSDYFTLLDDKFDGSKTGMVKNTGTGPSSTTAITATSKHTSKKIQVPDEEKKSGFPAGVFRHQGLKAVYATEGTSLLAIASRHHIQLSSILSYNEFPSGLTEIEEGQLVYLQHKRKTGKKEFHQVKKGETLHEISQTEGIRLTSLMQLNKLKAGMEPRAGQKLALKTPAKSRPLLAKILPTTKSKSATTIHVVKRGESLSTIAQRYRVSVDSIKEVNNIKRDELQVGQTLKIQK